MSAERGLMIDNLIREIVGEELDKRLSGKPTGVIRKPARSNPKGQRQATAATIVYKQEIFAVLKKFGALTSKQTDEEVRRRGEVGIFDIKDSTRKVIDILNDMVAKGEAITLTKKPKCYALPDYSEPPLKSDEYVVSVVKMVAEHVGGGKKLTPEMIIQIAKDDFNETIAVEAVLDAFTWLLVNEDPAMRFFADPETDQKSCRWVGTASAPAAPTAPIRRKKIPEVLGENGKKPKMLDYIRKSMEMGASVGERLTTSMIADSMDVFNLWPNGRPGNPVISLNVPLKKARELKEKDPRVLSWFRSRKVNGNSFEYWLTRSRQVKKKK